LKKPLIILLLLVLCKPIFAQNLNLSFNHLDREGGLSNNNAFSIYADSKSFLWLGTFNGLNRFDGSTCRVYKPFNSNIKGLNFSNLIEDKKGDLWSTSETGLNHYTRKTDSFEVIDCIKDGKLHHYIPFYVDDENKIWLIIEGEGIIVYNPSLKSYKKISNKKVEFAKVSSHLYQKVKRIFYADSNPGLNVLSVNNEKEGELKTFFDGKKQPSIDVARYFFIENDSLAWVTNNLLGLIKFNFISHQFQVFNSFQNIKIRNLTTVAFRPNSTQFFIGSNDLGVLIFDSNKAKFIQQIKHIPTNPYSLKSNWTEDLVIDNNQNLFVNILGWGIDFTNLNTSNTQKWLKKEDVNEYGADANDVSYAYIGKKNVYAKLQSGQSFKLDFEGNIMSDKKDIIGVSSLFRSSDNIIYGTEHGSISIYNEDLEPKQKFLLDEKLKTKDQTYSMTEISSNEFVVGAAKGLYCLKRKDGKYKIQEIDELKNADFEISNFVYFDKKTQQLFILSKWWSNFNIATRIKEKWVLQPRLKLEASVFNIVPDIFDTNKLWFCSNKGLLKFDVKTHKYDIWDEAKGLPDNSVTTFLPQKSGDFWLITNRGVSFYNNKSKVFKNFSTKDGATSSEYDWYGNNLLPDGRMMFAGTDGITIIDPKQFNTSTPPKLYITDIKINEKNLATADYVGESSSLNLKPDENSFSIDFVGIDYAKPQSIRLQYQLQGFDNEWITTINPANIHFSNVPDNTYIFKIRALSDNGKITAEKSLMINIATPFWLTWWFRLLILGILVGLTYAFYRYRINQLLEMQAVRNRISTDLHDEIGATLSGIGILSTIAKQQVEVSHPANALLGRITDDALTVGNAIDDIVWSINPNNDDLDNIIARMRRHSSELFDAKNIDYQIVTPENTEDIKLTMDQRREVYLIFKEAINNLLKYAESSKVNIEVKIQNRKFSLLIADNGIGFDTSKTSSRNGIKNMKNRAEKLKGKLLIESAPEKGTKVNLEFFI
jgi:two-component sensor histidine kinase/ligand-binding sensor domain-containing protein